MVLYLSKQSFLMFLKVMFNNVIFWDGKDPLFYDDYENMCKAPARHMKITIEIKFFNFTMLNEK